MSGSRISYHRPSLLGPRPPRVDFVVVAFNSATDLPSCLDAVAADAPPGAKTTVVDNASADNSAAVAAAHSVRATVVSSDANLGFGGACNLAAQRSDADYLFFVNPDARLHRGATAVLVATMEASPDVAVAGPRIVDPTGNSRVISAGAEPSLRSVLGHYLLASRLPGFGQLFRPLHVRATDAAVCLDWVSGAAMLVRRDAFEAVGGFDPQMFLYMEDVDLCRRLRACGWSIVYQPSAIASHRMGGSQDERQPARWYRAFHAYVGRQRGIREARACSVVAAVGLGARGLAYRRAAPRQSSRLLRAARVAAHLATAGPGPGSPA